MRWSNYQEAVFRFRDEATGDAAVESVAGSGKSSTAVELVQGLPRTTQVRFASFTNNIINDLTEKVRSRGLSNVRVQTYNSFGAGLVNRYTQFPPTLLRDYNGQKTDEVLKHDVLRGSTETNREDRETYFRCKAAIIKMVALFKSLAVMTEDDAAVRFDDVVDYYDVEQPEDRRFRELCLATWSASMARTDIIDFDDQKWLPLKMGWPVPQVDFLVVDEWQDSSPVEARLMLASCRAGRVVVFGDRNQAIYSFKGTTPDSMQEFVETRRAAVLPLSICYRCPRAAVRAAQQIVPHIEWAPDAVEGVVDSVRRDDFRRRASERDMVLARTTDDLVRSVIGFLGEGRAAYVEGREYGTQLKYFVTKFGAGAGTTDALMHRVWEHFHATHPDLVRRGREAAAVALETKCETLEVLAVGTTTVEQLERKVDSIFTDRGNGIRHLTAHKSKGLEGRVDGDVYVLRPDKIPHPRAKKPHMVEEERRLKYVVTTRTRRGLFWVQKERDEK